MKRIDTMSIRDILRHHHDLGLPRAEIAVAVSVSAGTVSNVLERAQAAGLSWPLPSDLVDDGLRARLYPPAPRESEYAQPDWDGVLHELRAKRKRRRVHATRRTLWEEYRDETKARGGNGPARKMKMPTPAGFMTARYEPGRWRVPVIVPYPDQFKPQTTMGLPCPRHRISLLAREHRRVSLGRSIRTRGPADRLRRLDLRYHRAKSEHTIPLVDNRLGIGRTRPSP